MKVLVTSPVSESMRWLSVELPSVVTHRDCVSPRVNSAEPWARGKDAGLDFDGAHGLGVASVDAGAFVKDALAHDLLFDVADDVADGGEGLFDLRHKSDRP